MKRLFWDIETSPNVVLSWRVGYDLRIDHDNIIKERQIICIGYKWEHEKEAHCLTWDKNQNDRSLVLKFLKIAKSADELIAQNGDKFDLPWFRTRCLFHGVKSLPRFKTADTLQWARRNFNFNSNKLDYMADFLGIGRKLHTDFGLWKAIVLKRDAKALARMVEYCKQDVILLEKVWKRLSMTVTPKTHVGVLHGNDSWACPRCGSESVITAHTRVTSGGTIHKQMQCKKCGGHHTINMTAWERFKEAKHKEKKQ